MKRSFLIHSALVAATLVVATSACSAQSEGTDTPSNSLVSQTEFDYQAHIEELNLASGLTDPPETELVRVVAPDEYATVWQACMAEAGQELKVTFDGGIGPSESLPSEQQEAWEIAFYVCVAEYPVDQSLIKKYGAEQIDLLYKYYVDTLVPCLEAEGFQSSDVPSLETYRSSWLITETGVEATSDIWFPYDSVPASTLTAEELESINLKCPQVPSDEFLFPED